MDKPFIIWTMRRTGGTALASLLGEFIAPVEMLHEPFNLDRAFGSITKAFAATRDEAALHDQIRAALESPVCIKQCVDILPVPVHAALRRVSVELGYNAFVLDRRDEAARILSALLAEQTTAWGPKDAKKIYWEIETGQRSVKPLEPEEIRHFIIGGRERRTRLAEILDAAGTLPPAVFFEDIYAGDGRGRAIVRALFDYLGVPRTPEDRFENALTDKLEGQSQNTQRIFPLVPNIDEARQILEADDGWRNPLAGLAPLTAETA